MELPSASIILLAYNQEKFVREAALAALSQEGDPIEVLLSDDNSSDQSYEILLDVAKSYTGKHKIILNRNAKNLGIMAHFKRAVSLTTGDWIIAAAGDDISAPSRARTILHAVSGCPHVKAAVSHHHLLADDGSAAPVGLSQILQMQAMQEWPGTKIISSMRDRKGSCFWIKGAAAAWSREVFERFDPLPEDRMINEDIVLMIRALILGNIRVIGDDLIGYRRHAGALSLFTQVSAESPEDLARARAAFMRTKASLVFAIRDVRCAARAGLLSNRDAGCMICALEDLLEYKNSVAEWPWMSFTQRLVSILRLWRPNKLRPGFRSLFAKRISPTP